MRVSRFGEKIQKSSGIKQLMDDLGEALAGRQDMLMLGGGNPAQIPRMNSCFREIMHDVLAKDGEFEKAIGIYNTPQGNIAFIEALAGLLRQEFGWDIKPANIALTTGSQSAFFVLFNMFAGEYADGSKRKVLLPLSPEYIGYCDVGLSDDFFASRKPRIEYSDHRIFKYHVDFDRIDITEEIGAICVSRPTNPTGNVLTNCEIDKLRQLACQHQIPFIIDNAYGTPFPNIIFTEAEPVWDENIIVCMSLSKLGLPATRTGIVIANEEIIRLVAEMNAVMTLAPGSLGTAIAIHLLRSGEILRLSREVIQPYYKSHCRLALEVLQEELDGVDYYIHKPEGALFLWIWFRGLGITDQQLYERLKKRGVLIVPGHYFFPGLESSWNHTHECIRMTYSQDEATVIQGIRIIAEEVKRAYL